MLAGQENVTVVAANREELRIKSESEEKLRPDFMQRLP
jgi:hypothetical protein